MFQNAASDFLVTGGHPVPVVVFVLTELALTFFFSSGAALLVGLWRNAGFELRGFE